MTNEFELNENDPKALEFAFKGGGGKSPLNPLGSGGGGSTTIVQQAPPKNSAGGVVEADADEIDDDAKKRKLATKKKTLKVPIAKTGQGAGLKV